MLKEVNSIYDVPELLNLETDLVPSLVNYEARKKAGEKIIFKVREKRNAIYFNVYVYDKSCWRFLLEDTFLVKEIV